MNRNKAKKFLSQNYLFLTTAKSIRFYIRKIFIGYRKYSGIPGRIHFNDQSLIKNNSDHYKSVGESAVKLIESALRESGAIIDENAVDFCKKEFNVIPIQSDTDFKKVKSPASHDLIWVGSLFTHIDSKDFQDLLETLISSLKEKGILIFTTHGKECLNRLDSYGLDSVNPHAMEKKLENTGFVFKPYPGQSHYGISICSRAHVLEAISQMFGSRVKLIFYKNKGWDHHQDVYAFQKTSNSDK